jgi:hypothetical protein
VVDVGDDCDVAEIIPLGEGFSGHGEAG